MATLFKHIPYDQIARIAPVLANGSGENIVAVKKRVGCDYIINAGTYNMTTRALDSGLKIDGEYLRQVEQHGLGINKDGRLEWSYAGKWSDTWWGYYGVGVYGDTLQGKHLTDRRQRTGIGYDKDGVILAATTENMNTVQFGAQFFDDAEAWINLDGGGSTQWIAPDGNYLSGRNVVWYIGIWLKGNAKTTEDKENTMITNLPVNGDFTITAAYGEENTKLWANGHKGIDIVADDKRIFAPCDGVVRVVAFDAKGWGQYVSIGGDDGYIHLLCHLIKNSVRVKKGDRVSRTTRIGTMGSTGNSTGVHLHYQRNTMAGTPTDPSVWTHVPNKRGKYSASDYLVDADGRLLFGFNVHWATEHYRALVARGVIDGGDTSSVWRQFDENAGKITIGELLALIEKATK